MGLVKGKGTAVGRKGTGVGRLQVDLVMMEHTGSYPPFSSPLSSSYGILLSSSLVPPLSAAILLFSLDIPES